MRSVLKVVMLPFTSETIATAIGGIGLTMMILPLIYYIIAIKLTEAITRIVVVAALLSPILLVTAAISLWMGAGFRSYRDNTKSRAMCELMSLFFLGMTILSARMHTA